MRDLERRLEVLENQLRRSRRFNQMFIGVVGLVVCVAAAQNKPAAVAKRQARNQSSGEASGAADEADSVRADHGRKVTAEEFTLVDRQGRVRARLEMAVDGPALSMFDDAGRKRLELAHANLTSRLSMFDSEESAVASLLVSDNGGRAHLEIKGAQNAATMKADGFRVEDVEGRGRLHLALLNGNFATLGLSHGDQTGPPSIEMSAAEASRGLRIHDADGFPLLSAFAGDDGAAMLSLRHPDHQRSLQVSSGPDDREGPVASFFATERADGGGVLPLLQLGLRQNRAPFVRIVDNKGKSRYYAPAE